ncbi:zinc-binding dehydrogenase [Massilia antarctica]|uniref:zinc-binding dehydrogenase n=1 Tax=Massilia antarctica TaxID=2765360 RepID=UPI0027D931BD|nr:zinc-binding dehydrogenase [Massilia sp. H27-R4]
MKNRVAIAVVQTLPGAADGIDKQIETGSRACRKKTPQHAQGARHDFPCSTIPMQEIVNLVAQGELRGKPARVFNFSEVALAHQLMERNQARGKFVVLV